MATHAATSTTTSTCTFLHLPKQIKDKIYEYALVADKPIDFAKGAFCRQSALLNTYTAVREEATTIFFSKNIFVITNLESRSMNLIKNSKGAITKLLINFTIPNNVREQFLNDPIAMLAKLERRAGSCLCSCSRRKHPPTPSRSAGRRIWATRSGGSATSNRAPFHCSIMSSRRLSRANPCRGRPRSGRGVRRN